MPNQDKSHDNQPEPIHCEMDTTLEQRWNKPIIVSFPKGSGYDHITYTPDSPVEKLELLAFAYEHDDPYARESMTQDDYCRLCAWLLAKEIGWHLKSKKPKPSQAAGQTKSTTSKNPSVHTKQNGTSQPPGHNPSKTSSTATLEPPKGGIEESYERLLERGKDLLRQSGLNPDPQVGIADEYFSFVFFMWFLTSAVSGVILFLHTQGNFSETADLLYRMTLAPWLGHSTADLFPARLPSSFQYMAIILHGIPLIFLLVVPTILLIDYFRKLWELNRTIRLGQTKDQRGSLEKPHVIRSSYSVADCCALVKSAFDLSTKGKHRWSTVVYHPGQFIHAELQFEERFGGTNELMLNRQILLSVYFTERADGTDIQLDYEIFSPLNRSTCKGIVERMTGQLEWALST